MNEENPRTIRQHENSKEKFLRKLVATSRHIISFEVGVPVGISKMRRLITWLEQSDVRLSFPVFEEYWKAILPIPSGRERLNCSREALRRYDADLGPINLDYHDRIIDACYEIIETYGKLVDDQEMKEQPR